MNTNKSKFILQITVFALVVLSILAFTPVLLARGNTIQAIMAIIIALILIILPLPFLIRNYKAIKRGEPLKDERTKRIETKAATFSYYVSIYLWLAVMYINDYFMSQGQCYGRQLTGAGIAGMAVLFGLFYFYFSRKGDN